jgi:hypothetical protein
MLKRTHYALLF